MSIWDAILMMMELNEVHWQLLSIENTVSQIRQPRDNFTGVWIILSSFSFDLKECHVLNCILFPKLFRLSVKKKCSSDQEKLLKFEVEGRKLANFLRSLEYIIHSNSERSEQFFVTECFPCSWRFLISNKLEQLEFEMANIIGI